MHVESGFVVQRKRASGTWETLAGTERPALPLPRDGDATEQPDSVTFTDTPGPKTYRVLALTEAPGQPHARDHADNESASHAATVTVLGTPDAPVITSFSASGSSLSAAFTWDGWSPYFLRWTLSRASAEDGTYESVGTAMVDSLSPVTFSSQSTPYWYKLRADVCEHRVAGRGSARQSSDDQTLICGPSTLSSAVYLPVPPPPPVVVVTIHIPAGELINIVWPGATVRVATAARPLPVGLAIWWYDDDAEDWVVYITGAPDFVNTNFLLRTGESYSIRSQLEVDYQWRIVAAYARSSSSAAEGASAEPASDSGWTALVTCDSGLSPVRLGLAPTEAEAISAAQWFINSPLGCGGAGTYTVSYRP